MRYYFVLQSRRLNRKFLELGINPYLGYALIATLFVLLSVLLFYKTSYAIWIYPFVALSFLIQIGNRDRTVHLQSIFNAHTYKKVRLIENGITVLPFMIFMFYQKNYLPISLLATAAIVLALLNTKSNFNLSIPTPFKKYPFESIVGFRKNLWLILLSYFILIKAIQVGNYNLGAAVLVLNFLISMSNYFKPENEYFVWIFSAKSSAFIKKKIVWGIICNTIMVLPVLVSLIIFFKSMIIYSLTIFWVANIYLLSIIIAKYSAFPKEMSLPQVILYSMCFWFPPMILVVVPIFYNRAKKSLTTILG